MLSMEVEEIGLERARQAFTNTVKNIKDLSPVWQLYRGFHIADLVPSAFATRGSAYGKSWPKYSPAYLAKRRKEGFGGGQMLVLRGDLKAAATGGTGFTSRITKQELTMAISGIPHLRVHQFGYKPKNIPARPYFFDYKGGLPARAVAFLIKTAENHITKDVEK